MIRCEECDTQQDYKSSRCKACRKLIDNTTIKEYVSEIREMRNKKSDDDYIKAIKSTKRKKTYNT